MSTRQPQFTERTILTPLWIENARDSQRAQARRDRRTTAILSAILALSTAHLVWFIIRHL